MTRLERQQAGTSRLLHDSIHVPDGHPSIPVLERVSHVFRDLGLSLSDATAEHACVLLYLCR